MGEKLIRIGLGFSNAKDAYTAAKEAAQTALKQLDDKTPNISFVFYAGQYDVEQLNKALVETFEGTEFVGGSTDAVIYKDGLYADGIVVASLFSDYIQFGAASIDNITKNPKELAKKTIEKAVQKIPFDQYVQSYMAFSRVKKGDITEMIRIPSFFVFAFTRGFQPTRMGNEDLIIDGIGEKIGYYVPIFGGSLGNNMDLLFSNKPYEIFSLHNGKIMKDGLIVVFGYSGLLYASSIAHGAKPLNTMGYVSKVRNNGFVVEEINEKHIIEWYADNIGVSKEEFLSKVLFYTQKYPLGFPDGYGNIVMRAGGVPFENDLSYIAPLKENTPIFLMDLADNKQLGTAVDEINKDIKKHLSENIRPDISFVISCSSRRRVLDNKSMKREIHELNNKSRSPIFGFASFGEIGSKAAGSCHFHHLANNVFNIYNRLLSK